MRQVRERERANEDCWTCPECGHEIEDFPKECLIVDASYFFNKEVYTDIYECACGCIWESDPYCKGGEKSKEDLDDLLDDLLGIEAW